MSGTGTLVVAPNWVGDLVMALPTVESLRGSGRRLTLLARPHLLPLLRLVPAVDHVLERGSDRQTIDSIRDIGCGEAVILPNSFRAAWLPFRAGVPLRWGYRTQLRAPLLSRPVDVPRRDRHQVDDYRELLLAMGVPPGDGPPRLTTTAELARRAEALLRRARLPEEGPLIGLFPGAEFGPSKRWPIDRFVELARRLRRSLAGARLVIVAGPKELWLAVRIHEAVGRVAPVLGPDLDLAGLAAVLQRLDLLVTNDSGPMHLAAALGVPCIALFGPTDPRRTRPAGDGHTVIYRNRWCSPCFRRRCPLLHHRCLREIGVEAVGDAALATLGRRASGEGEPD